MQEQLIRLMRKHIAEIRDICNNHNLTEEERQLYFSFKLKEMTEEFLDENDIEFGYDEQFEIIMNYFYQLIFEVVKEETTN